MAYCHLNLPGPQEMLLAGYGYGNTLVALALVDRGASLNEVLEQRQRHLWPEVARRVEVDVDRLPGAIRDLMSSGIDQPAPEPLHFLPDVRQDWPNACACPPSLRRYPTRWRWSASTCGPRRSKYPAGLDLAPTRSRKNG